MTDISIIGTGCLIVALVVAAGIVVRLRRKIARLQRTNTRLYTLTDQMDFELACFEEAESKRRAQRIAAAKKGREAQAAAKLAKVGK